MGKMEYAVKKKARRARIQDVILVSLYGAAALTLMAAAPNALKLLRYVDPLIEKKRDPTRRMQQALSRLQSRGFVERRKGQAGTTYRLTEKGRQHAVRLHQAQQLFARKPPRWDGRWRVVVFDIWERRRLARDRLRTLLQRIGYTRLQDSVWVYPYDSEEVLVFIRTELKLGRGMRYIIAEGIENDIDLRRHFDLPLS